MAKHTAVLLTFDSTYSDREIRALVDRLLKGAADLPQKPQHDRHPVRVLDQKFDPQLGGVVIYQP